MQAALYSQPIVSLPRNYQYYSHQVIDLLKNIAGKPPLPFKYINVRNKAAIIELEKLITHLEILQSNRSISTRITSQLLYFANEKSDIIHITQTDWGAAKLVDFIFDETITLTGINEQSSWLLNRFRMPVYHHILRNYSALSPGRNIVKCFFDAISLQLQNESGNNIKETILLLDWVARQMHESFDGKEKNFLSLCHETLNWNQSRGKRRIDLIDKVSAYAAESSGLYFDQRMHDGSLYCSAVLDFNLGDWIKLTDDDGRFEIYALVYKGDKYKPWLFMDFTGLKVKKLYESEMQCLKLKGHLSLIGLGNYFEKAISLAIKDLSSCQNHKINL